MKPFLHGRIHAKKYGGIPEDYADIDDFIDSSKIAFPDIRHRAILHSSFGCYLVEQMFGRVRTNSAGISYSPRDVAEDHVLQDLGFIPTPENYLKNMKEQLLNELKTETYVSLGKKIMFPIMQSENG